MAGVTGCYCLEIHYLPPLPMRRPAQRSCADSILSVLPALQVPECARLALKAVEDGMAVVIGLQVS